MTVRKPFVVFTTALTVLLSVCLLPAQVFADSYENTETGYTALIQDEADLLSPSEEADLLEELKAITEYSNAAFVSITENSYSTEHFAYLFCENYFENEEAVVFVIDMDNRYLWIECQGAVSHTITDDYAQTITDNVYGYASKGDYYSCASTAFSQIARLLEGKWIAQPMKYISNAFLAIAVALLINYFLVMMLSRSRKATAGQLLNGIYSNVAIQNAHADFTHQTRQYSPQSTASSSGGSSGHSGGGGGGSSHSGGGHRF